LGMVDLLPSYQVYFLLLLGERNMDI